jgi:multiple sugar transport system ATP-binding protein
MSASAPHAEVSIECEGLTKVYSDGTKALDSLDLSVEPGHVLALVGPSGCGKTSLLRMVAGLEQITAGELRIDGRVANRLSPRERNIAMIFQNYALYPHMNVFDNMAFGLRVRRAPKSETADRVRAAGDLLGLIASLKKKPAHLSGGQRQRVAMGRAIVRSPGIFLMDEPLSNLDAQLRVRMRMEIARLQRRLGVTTIYVTHDQIEAMVLGDRVAVLKGGVLQQYGTPEAVYERPANVFVARFIGSPSMNLFEATVTESEDETQVTYGQSVLHFPRSPTASRSLPRGSHKLICGIRPEALEELVGTGSAEERPSIGGLVELREQLGSEVLVHVSVPGAPPALGGFVDDAGAVDETAIDPSGFIVARLNARSRAREGDAIQLAVDPTGVHFFDPVTEQHLAAALQNVERSA